MVYHARPCTNPCRARAGLLQVMQQIAEVICSEATMLAEELQTTAEQVSRPLPVPYPSSARPLPVPGATGRLCSAPALRTPYHAPSIHALRPEHHPA